MAVNMILTLLISVYVVFSRARLAEGCSFNVSVPENAEVGTEVVDVRQRPAMQKAELLCVKREGDPYDRFLLTKECTLEVANPLDWSIQSEYTIKIRVGFRREVTSVSIQVTDVSGYPPVYNETCETPINPGGKDTREYQFRFEGSVEAETDTGDVFAVRNTLGSSLDERSRRPDALLPYTENGNCQVQELWIVRSLSDLVAADQLWNGHFRNLSCRADVGNSKLFIRLFSKTSMSHSFLSYVRERYSGVLNFIYKFTLTFRAKSTVRFVCKFPPIGKPFRALSRRPNPIRLAHVQSLNIDVHPQGCPMEKYGLLCDKNCVCKNGARCHGFNGACKCQHGWQGVACDIRKPDIALTTTPSDTAAIYIYTNVTIHCRVYHIDVDTLSLQVPKPNASEITSEGVNQLDIKLYSVQIHDEGRYTCQARDKGGKVFNATIALNVNCPPNRKGELCDEVCDCVLGASCDRWAGCVCPPGWTGTRCQTQCQEGTYGKDCAKTCGCQHGASCSPDDGRCNCTAGWYGSRCDGACPKSRYGWRCRQVCSCENNATCHHVDGSCSCVPPWGGRDCDKLHVIQTASLIEILVPLGSILLVVTAVLIVLYKTGQSLKREDHEAEVLRELSKMEHDLAQSLQPGWLRRWEKKIHHLTPGPLIGEGMFGLVRKAQLLTPEGELDVAAKTVRVEDSQSYRDFYREAAILVAVHQVQNGDHRESNIIRLLGLITKSVEKFILLEYAPKGDLLGFLRGITNVGQENLLENLLGFAVHISRALQELASLRIAHRDVAARNVLITADDVAKLADFGLARDVYATTQYVRCNRPGVDELLPLKWMALESIETGEYTCHSDVWSFGVLLWEIATLGKDPCYDGRIQLDFLQMVGILRRGRRMERPPGCPEDLYRLMRSCWRDVPGKRPTPDGLEKRLLQLLPHDVIEMETAL